MSALGMIALLNPAMYRQIVEQEKRAEAARYKWLKEHERPQDWDEAATKFAKVMYLRAESWDPPRLFDVPPLTGTPGTRVKNAAKNEAVVWSPCGRFLYCHHLLPAGTSLTVAQGSRRGKVYFDGDVVVPTLCEKLPGKEVPRVWMSYTPSEILQLRKGVMLASGKVVVGGLGMGYFLNTVCRKKSVTDVCVVEKEKGLIDWLWGPITDRFPHVRAKAAWHHADVWDFLVEHKDSLADRKVLLDTWDSYPVWDPRFTRWKKVLGPRLWGWGCVAIN